MFGKIPSDVKSEKPGQDKKLHVYLAGPDVFYPAPAAVGAMKKRMIEEQGCVGHYPLDTPIPEFKADEATALKIAEANEALMDMSQVILVNMTPWHGPSMDVGTAFETGYMRAKAKHAPGGVLIIGYYEGMVNRSFMDRVAAMVCNNDVVHHADGLILDQKGNSLENFSLPENLMITSAIKKTGGFIFSSFEEAVDNITMLWAEKQQPKGTLLETEDSSNYAPYKS